MKILLTNHHLREFTGSEVQTFILAKYLTRYNHEVTVYSKFTNEKFIKQFTDLNIPVINDLEQLKEVHFDLAHVHHNICAYEVRHYFPNLPMVMWIQGVIPFLENPPAIDLHISKFLVNNQNGRQFVIDHGVNANDVIIVRNLVDSDTFFQTSKIAKTPKKALVISNKITKEKELLLKQALRKMGIKYEFVGKRFKIIPHDQLSNYINNVDIVFTVALGAMESMMCGRIPILYDYNFAPYDDGIVTVDNFDFLKEYNFSGRATKKIFNFDDLVKEIEKYDYSEGDKLLKMATENYSADRRIHAFIDIYKDIINSKKSQKVINTKVLNHLVNVAKETKIYSYSNIYMDTVEPLLAEKKQLETKNELILAEKKQLEAKNELISIEADEQLKQLKKMILHRDKIISNNNDLIEKEAVLLEKDNQKILAHLHEISCKIDRYKIEYHTIIDSKFFKAWQFFNRLKKVFSAK